MEKQHEPVDGLQVLVPSEVQDLSGGQLDLQCIYWWRLETYAARCTAWKRGRLSLQDLSRTKLLDDILCYLQRGGRSWEGACAGVW